MSNEMKKCAVCKQAKPFEMFSRNKYQRDGLNHVCRFCVKQKSDRQKKTYVTNSKQRG